VLRRCDPGRGRHARRVGALAIDHAGREVRCLGQRVELSRMEWALLTYLAGDPQRVFTKRELLRDVWGYKAEGTTRPLVPIAETPAKCDKKGRPLEPF
jgi:DNA-binding response OmpR family regulator